MMRKKAKSLPAISQRNVEPKILDLILTEMNNKKDQAVGICELLVNSYKRNLTHINMARGFLTA